MSYPRVIDIYVQMAADHALLMGKLSMPESKVPSPDVTLSKATVT